MGDETYSTGQVAKKLRCSSEYVRQIAEKRDIIPVLALKSKRGKVYRFWSDTNIADIKRHVGGKRGRPYADKA